MKVLYNAENSIDANLLKDMLEQAGIMAFVNGQFLQGGIGELPAAGLITVSVADPDHKAAMGILNEFQENMGQVPGTGETRWDPSDELLDWEG
jgi:hypothetical protein